MANGPDLDEMVTTTQRNRSVKAKKPPFGGKKAQPFQKRQPEPMNDPMEGSPMDMAQDKIGAKRKGMAPEEYEGSPEDEMQDRKAMPKPQKGLPSKGPQPKGGGMHVAIMISPMSNPPAEHRASVRDSINKSIGQIKRRK